MNFRRVDDRVAHVTRERAHLHRCGLDAFRLSDWGLAWFKSRLEEMNTRPDARNVAEIAVPYALTAVNVASRIAEARFPSPVCPRLCDVVDVLLALDAQSVGFRHGAVRRRRVHPTLTVRLGMLLQRFAQAVADEASRLQLTLQAWAKPYARLNFPPFACRVMMTGVAHRIHEMASDIPLTLEHLVQDAPWGLFELGLEGHDVHAFVSAARQNQVGYFSHGRAIRWVG